MFSFWSAASAKPEHVAVIEADGTTITAGELDGAANRVVHALRKAARLASGDAIVVALTNRTAFLALYFAAMQAGWYFVPISPHATAPELEHILADSGAKAIVFEAELAAVVETALAATGLARSRAWSIEPANGFASYAALIADAPTTAPPDRCAGEGMLYTSGTTGRPRAVLRPLQSCSPELRADRAVAHRGGVAGVGPSNGDIHIVTSPLYHSASLYWCTLQLNLGNTVVLMGKWRAEDMLATIARHRATGAFMVPTHFHRLLALPADVKEHHDLSSLRRIVHGGAPCAVELKRRMLDWWGDVIHEVYGSTEGGTSSVGPREWRDHPGTVGKPGPDLRIMRDDGTRCAPGEVGVIFLGRVEPPPQPSPSRIDVWTQPPFVYHNDPDKTAAARRDGFFTVGDMGYVDADGYLFLSGRASELINTGGVKVHPTEVEGALLSHPAVGDAAVFGVPDDEWGEQVKAVIEPAAGVAPTAELAAELVRFCRERLDPAKCPRSIDFLTPLPRAPNGKLYKRELQTRYARPAASTAR